MHISPLRMGCFSLAKQGTEKNFAWQALQGGSVCLRLAFCGEVSTGAAGRSLENRPELQTEALRAAKLERASDVEEVKNPCFWRYDDYVVDTK